MQDETDIEHVMRDGVAVHASPLFPDSGLLPPLRYRSTAKYLAYYYPKGLIVIVDMGTNEISVTNDVENIIYDVNKAFYLGNFIKDCLVVYRDSDGYWDQIIISKDGNFAGFESIHETRLCDAVRKISGELYDAYQQNFKFFDDNEWLNSK